MLKLTATELPRFMACNGSVLLPKAEEFEPDMTSRDEGNTVHWLIEQVFSGQFIPEELIDRKSPFGVYVTPEMVEHANPYLKDLKGYIEFNTSFSGEGYEIKGRADNASFENGVMTIADFKYGWRIVEPENNWTLISHAIGYALNLINSDCIRSAHDIQQVDFKIYQPRPFHPEGSVRTWSITSEELLNFHNQLNTTVSQRTNICNTGEHCHRCPSYTSCSAALKSSMNAVDISDVAFNFELDDERMSPLLDVLYKAEKTLKTAIKAYEDEACNRLKRGKVIKNYSLERSLTNRKWNEHITPEVLEMMTGRDDLIKTELITPAQAVAKGLDEEVVNSLSGRKETGFKLRKINPTKKVEKMFGDFFKQKGNEND